MLEVLYKLLEHTYNDEALPQPSDNVNIARRKAGDMVLSIKKILTTNTELVPNLRSVSQYSHNADGMFCTPPRRRINIDKAVKVLQNLSFKTKKTEKHYTKNVLEHIATHGVDTMVGNRIRRALNAFQKLPDGSNPNNAGGSSNCNCSGRFLCEKARSGKKRKPDGKDHYWFN